MTISIKTIVFSFVFCGFALFLPLSTQAQTAPTGQIKPINTLTTVTKAQFEARSKLFKEKPLDDKHLAYEVRLPDTWVQVRSEGESLTELSTKLLGDLSQYVSPPRPDIRSTFRLRAVKMEHLMAPENWMLNFILSNGYTLEGMTIRNARRVEAQYVVLKNASVSTVRAVAELSGSSIVLAEYSVPAELMEEDKDDQLWSMLTFRLTTPDKGPVEKLETFSFLDLAKFNFPKSWILNAPSIQSVERIDAAIINLRGKGDSTLLEAGEKPKLDGRIDVSLVAKSLESPIPEEIKRIKSDLESKGLFLGKKTENKTWKTDPSVLKSWIEVYATTGKEGQSSGYEVWVAIIELPEQYYYVRLLTLSRTDDFYIWARNIKAFETVVTTLRPNVDEQ